MKVLEILGLGTFSAGLELFWLWMQQFLQNKVNPRVMWANSDFSLETAEVFKESVYMYAIMICIT